MLDLITPVILTYNEEPNLQRTLDQLHWAKEIIIVDSFSQDRTLDIAAQYPQVKLVQRKFDTHATQWNYAVSQAQTPWVICLDADYVLSDELIAELSALDARAETEAYIIGFKYCVFGKALSGTIYPAKIVMFKKGVSQYRDDGHTQLMTVDGPVQTLVAPIYHDDRKPLSRWVWAQQRYVELEVKKLQGASWEELGWSDRLRSMKLIAPFIIFIYCLFVKRTIFDGRAGWFYTFQRLFFELWLSIRLVETTLRPAESSELKSAVSVTVQST